MKEQIIKASGLALLLFPTLSDFYRSLRGKLADKLVAMDRTGANRQESAETITGLIGLRIKMCDGNTNESYILLKTDIENIHEIKSVATVVNELVV